MIGLLPTTGIFLPTAPTDLRKAYDGLAAMGRQGLGQDPLSGSLYVFCSRRKDRIKILFWEEGGYWLFGAAAWRCAPRDR
jgi:transposase